MDSGLLLLAGVFGASVRCVKPFLLHPSESECNWPSPGDLGRVIGLIQDGSRLSVLVRMDDVDDFEDLSYARFKECFAVDTTRNSFKPVLG